MIRVFCSYLYKDVSFLTLLFFEIIVFEWFLFNALFKDEFKWV